MTRIRGSFPGGPSREPADAPARAPRLQSVAEIEGRLARRTTHRGRQERRTRLAVGLTGACFVALAVGLLLGRMSHTTAERLRAEQLRQNAAAAMTSEVNRVLMQLWAMEDLEAARGRGRVR